MSVAWEDENTSEVVEELQYAIDETAGEGGVIENLESIAINLESILSTGGSLDAAGFRMYNCAMESNLRRLGMSHKEATPSMECFDDPALRRGATRIAMEGVFSAIGDALKKVWEWVAGLFRMIGEFLGLVGSKADKAADRTDAVDAKVDKIEAGEMPATAVVNITSDDTAADIKDITAAVDKVSLPADAVDKPDKAPAAAEAPAVEIPHVAPAVVGKAIEEISQKLHVRRVGKLNRTKAYVAHFDEDHAGDFRCATGFGDGTKTYYLDTGFAAKLSKQIQAVGFLNGPVKLASSHIETLSEDISKGDADAVWKTTEKLRAIRDAFEQSVHLFGGTGIGGAYFTIMPQANVENAFNMRGGKVLVQARFVSGKPPTKEARISASFSELTALKDKIRSLSKHMDSTAKMCIDTNKTIAFKILPSLNNIKQNSEADKRLYRGVQVNLYAVHEILQAIGVLINSTGGGVKGYVKLHRKIVRAMVLDGMK